MEADLSGVGCKFRPQNKCQGNAFISAIIHNPLQYTVSVLHCFFLSTKCVLYALEFCGSIKSRNNTTDCSRVLVEKGSSI